MAKQLTKEPAKRFNLTTVGHVAVFALAAFAAWYLGRGFARLYDEWNVAGQAADAPPPAEPSFNSMASLLPLAGQWSFGALEWDLRSQLMEEAKADVRLQQMAAMTPGDHPSDLPDLSQELADYIAKLNITPFEFGGNQVYELKRPTFKARLVLRDVGGKMKPLAMAAAIPTQGGQWQLFELTPRGLSDLKKDENDHLLPLPEGAVRVGGRHDDNGQLLLEFVTLKSPGDALIQAWRNAGWEVRQSGVDVPGGFSYLCARGNDVVYAWSANSADALENLMLVRTPDAKDTSP